MKKIFFILIILNFIILKPTAAQNSSDASRFVSACLQQKINPKLIFSTSYGKLTYDTSYSRENLTNLGKNSGIFEQGDLASGLALVDIASEYELSVTSRSMMNGAACLIPEELNVYIGFQNPVIYLANDLKPNSCLYNLVVRHEQVHQQINVNALEYFIPLIYDRIKLIVSQMEPMYIYDANRAKEGINEMTTHYAEQINALVDEFKQEILTEQKKMDNRQHYQLENTICQTFNKKNEQKK